MSKSISFSYSATRIGIVLAIVTIIGVMLSLVIFGINPNQSRDLGFGRTQYPVTLQSLASGCGDTYQYTPGENQSAQLPADSSSYVNIPRGRQTIPVYGYLTETGLSDDQIRFYQKNEETDISRSQILRTMYDKNTFVIWYASDIAPDDYALMKEYVDATSNVLAIKWAPEYGEGTQPGDRKIALTTWGFSQSCEFWNEGTAKSFRSFVTENKVSRPEEPTIAEVRNGKLPEIQLSTSPAS